LCVFLNVSKGMIPLTNIKIYWQFTSLANYKMNKPLFIPFLRHASILIIFKQNEWWTLKKSLSRTT
jgi:hypothetical protein